MDSITHIVLGATVGELVAGRRLGKRAMFLGAIANSLPDIDFLAAMWLPTARDVWVHRGITHSFLFVLVVGPLLAWLARRWWPRVGIGWRGWLFFFCLQLFLHIFLDAFNAYGTGWFEPFSHYRVSWHVLFVADPLYTIWLLVTTVALAFFARDRARRKWAWVGLIGSTCYLLFCITNKVRVDEIVKEDMRRQGIGYHRYFSTPTPLNSLLWYVVAADSGGFHTGYRSIFDKSPTRLRWVPRNDSELAPFRGQVDVRYLLRFSQGYYTVE
ncbi:MAG: metal-dependent hydrolase, partial [Bacteroidetes bacterium]|nr:metal-dependent hydrolase [Bacteroidota bacterium]